MKKAKLLWVDLEMTGLEPDKDKILEVAAIATDMELNEVARYEAIVKVDENFMKSRMVGDFWVQEVENELLKFIDKNCTKELYLAGNSIHQDRKFIEREMPKLNERLHYRMLDVSAWKIYFENALKKKFIKPENHRALDDINGSIEELKWYLTFLK